jgi:hypothetical protein
MGTGLTGEEHRSDRCATTQSGIFEAEDTRQDRKVCVEAKQVAVVGHPSDGESLKTSKTALEGLVSLIIRKGYFRAGCGRLASVRWRKLEDFQNRP